MKHLPNLLRNKANSQQYPSIYEDRRPKSIEVTEKTDEKRIASGRKVPGTSTGTRATAAPGPRPSGLLQNSWERAELMISCPAKQGLSSTMRDLVAWSHREGNKDKVVNPQRPGALAEESWKLGLLWSWPGQSRSSWRGGLSERTGSSLYRGRQMIEQEDFPKKKKTLGALWEIPLQQQLQSPLH